jgi:hypothetical protein
LGIKKLLTRAKKPKHPEAGAPETMAVGADSEPAALAGLIAMSGGPEEESGMPVDALPVSGARMPRKVIIDPKTGEPLPDHWEWFQKLTGDGRWPKAGELCSVRSARYGHPREKDDMPAELKVSSYASDDGTSIYVAYAIFHGNRCVVTLAHGASRSFVLNCPRAAEAISGSEGREIGSLRFYHLWIEGGASRAKPGSVRFQEVVLSRDDADAKRVFVDRNVRANCPGYVAEVFKGHMKGAVPQPDSESALDDF